MAIRLTTSWQEVARKRATWSGTASRDCTVVLFARYDPSQDTSTQTRIEQKVSIIFNDSGFNGTWCNNGGHYQGANYLYPGEASASWKWEDQGTFTGTGASQYDDLFFDYWTVAKTDGVATATLGTRWIYPYYGMTAENTEFTVDVYVGDLAPSGLSRTNVIAGTDNFKATVSVTAWNGGTSASRYRSLSVCAAQNTTNRRVAYEYGDTLSSQITTDNNSSETGSLTIQPNTRYYLHSTATNGTASVEDGYTAAVTLAEKPTVTVESTTQNSATLGYATSADGGFYNKIIEWSEDDGATWNTAATITGGSAAQGTFTITNLTTGEHTVLVRSRTTSGNDGSVSITFTTAAVRIIASDGTTGREATTILVPVEGIATEASRLLVSHNGIATENA